MSRGPGVRQRKILDRLAEANGRGVYVSPVGAGPAEGAALRRAAYKLDAAGTIAVRVRKGRLVAFLPDAEGIGEDRVTVGLDRRLYRNRYGDTRESMQERMEDEALNQALFDRYAPIAESHGHPHGPGILLCAECAEAAGADDKLLAQLRAMNDAEQQSA